MGNGVYDSARIDSSYFLTGLTVSLDSDPQSRVLQIQSLARRKVDREDNHISLHCVFYHLESGVWS